MKEIKPYIMKRSHANGLDFYHYLHIQGGSGSKNGYGGQYAFCLTYLAPDEARDIDMALDYFCKAWHIPCGVGDTIEEAYADYQLKVNQ